MTSPHPLGALLLPARIALFGFQPSEAAAWVRPRPRAWRVRGALRMAAAGLLAAPVAGLIPPHAPWIVGALGVGGLLARRRWQERFTLEGVEGPCPRCGAQVTVRPGRLRTPHPVPCEACHHEGSLELSPDQLESVASD